MQLPGTFRMSTLPHADRRRGRRRSRWISLGTGALLLLGACAVEPAPPATTCPASPRPTEGRVRVAGVVLPWVMGNKEWNWRRLEPRIREAAANGAQIVCTTECALDGYAVCDPELSDREYHALGEEIPSGALYRRFAELADELDVVLVVGMQEREREASHNTAVVLGPSGELAGKYHKRKLGFEQGRNQPGDRPLVVPTAQGALGVMICADRTERELVTELAEAGAELIVCPSGGVFGPRRNDPILQRRSRENGLPIVFVHPVEFLVTLADGSIAARALLGEQLWVRPAMPEEDLGPGTVFYFDLAVGTREAAAR